MQFALKRNWLGPTCFLAMLLWSGNCEAQWITQQIKLVPGFNPVYLQVTPANGDCEAVFGSIPAVEHVWMYNRYLQTATFTSNPTDASASQDHWLTWFPARSQKSFLSTLSQVRGGQAYLIFLATNSAPITVNIKGVPAPPRLDWIPFELTLSGFPITESGKVTFYQFLKDSPEVSTQPGTASGIYSIHPLSARETQIRNPDITAITPGKAYWARLNAHSKNPYPIGISAPGENNSVQFRQDTKLASITLINSVKTGPQTVRLRLLESEAAPAGKPIRAGTVPVAALLPQADGSYRPQYLEAGVELRLEANEVRQLRLGLAVEALTPTSESNATYQALIEVTEESHGYRQLVPVVAEVPGSGLTAQGLSLFGVRTRQSATVATEAQSAGLWVGSLTLTGVNQPGFATTNNPDLAQFPTVPATPLEVRALIHVDSNGVSRLLQQVYFAEVTEGSNQVVRMFSSRKNFPAGAKPKSRISAPSWPVMAPTVMSGAFGDGLSATVQVPYNHPVNPFVHRYHPDHNNLAEDFATPLGAGEEAFEISRQAKFYFGVTTKSGELYTPAVPSLKFNGAAGEYARTSGFTNTTSLTVQFWANIPTNVQQSATVALLTNSTTRTQFQIAFQTNSGLLAVTVRNKAGAVATAAMNSAVPMGRWFNFMAAYDGSGVNMYVDGEYAGYGALPALESGVWDAAWLGNTATAGTPSFVGQIHDFVARNGAVSLQNAPVLMTTPDMIDPASIQINLQGDALTTNLVNRTGASLKIAMNSTSIVNLAAAPATPLWTFGSAQGFYSETITGLRKQAISINGSFQFTRVSQDSILR